MFISIIIVFLGAYLLLVRAEEKKEFKTYLRGKFTSSKTVKRCYRDFFFHLTKSGRLIDQDFDMFRKLPPFLFYKDMIGDYLTLTNKMGISPTLWGQGLRQSFSNHFNFWNKSKKKLNEIVVQTFIVYALSYLLGFSITFVIPEIEISFLVIIVWQLSGLFILIILYRYFYNKKFLGLKESLFSLISFSVLTKIGLSQQKVIELSCTNQLNKKASFSEIDDWLISLIQSWSQTGRGIREELELLMNEAWWQFDERMDEFAEFLQVLRLMILFLFGLPSFFYLIFEFTLKLF